MHALTGGNPFFVTEVAKDPDRPLPASVRDAVLARTADVAPDDFEVLQLAATAPDRLDDRLLPALGVDLPTLRRLHATGLLTAHPRRPGRSATSWPGWPWRAPSRPVAARGCTPGCSTRWSGSSRGTPAVLTHHAVAARDAAARGALRRGGRRGGDPRRVAHRGGGVPADRAGRTSTAPAGASAPSCCTRLSYEQYMTSQLGDAIEQRQRDVPAVAPGRRRRRAVRGARDRARSSSTTTPAATQAEAHADRAAEHRRRTGAELRVRRGAGDPRLPGLQRSDFELAPRVPATTRAASPTSRSDGATRAPQRGSFSAVADLAGATSEAAAAAGRPRSRRRGPMGSTSWRRPATPHLVQPRRRAAPLPRRRARAGGVAAVHRGARHPDLPTTGRPASRSRLHFAQGRWSAALEDAEPRARRATGMPLAAAVAAPRRTALRRRCAGAAGTGGRPISRPRGSWPSSSTSRCAGCRCCRRSPSRCG